MASAVQNEWVGRVLGVVPSSSSLGGKAPDVLAVWTEAKDAIDSRLHGLAQELRSYNDPDFDQIADKGLFGVMSGGETVGLIVQLRQYMASSSEQRDNAASAVRAAVDAYRTMLDGNPAVELLDDNPFGVDVMLFGTMDHALKQITTMLNH